MAVIIGDLKLGNLWRSPAVLMKLLDSHLNRYPLMEIQDAYKLLYQAALGLERSLHVYSDFEEDLLEEWQRVTASAALPSWEDIHPHGLLVRFHLAPFKARAGQPSKLATICYWSAPLLPGNIEDLKNGWETLRRMCHEKRWGRFSAQASDEFDQWLKRYQFPPVQHSERYRREYQPAYRLVLREFLGILLSGSED